VIGEHRKQLSALNSYSLLEALTERRSRRFGKGFRLNGGPLAYESSQLAQPLTMEEEAALAFAACGVTGYALAELPYQTGTVPEAAGGNIMTHFVARTVSSGDALHTVPLFMTNDVGAWMLKRPQDCPRGEIAELSRLARERKLDPASDTRHHSDSAATEQRGLWPGEHLAARITALANWGAGCHYRTDERYELDINDGSPITERAD